MQEVHGTKEWAASNFNIISGCKHGCWYCYARSLAARFGRHATEDWTEERPNKKQRTRFGKRTGRIMFPSSHDITPESVKECGDVLLGMLKAGNDVLVVSKPHLSVVQELVKRLAWHKDKVLFRFTIGSTSDKDLQLFEPGAPPFAERLAALRCAHEAGFETSVSAEPMLTRDPEALFKKVSPYVTDAVWFGLLNGVSYLITMNRPPAEVAKAARELRDYWTRTNVQGLYAVLGGHEKVKWKESIKKVVGIAVATEKGLDI